MRGFVAALAQAQDIISQLRTPEGRRAWRAELGALWSGIENAQWLWRAGFPHEPALERCLEHWARLRPNDRAFSDEAETLDWSTLRKRVRSWAARLSKLGVAGGSKVALVAENSANVVVALFAIRAAGGVPLLLDPHNNRDWQVEALREFGAQWVVYEEPGDVESLALKARCRAVGFAELSLGGERASTERQPQPRGNSEPFVVLATSGSTGKPKLVSISNSRCVLSGFGIAGCCLVLNRTDAIHCVLPLSHATAFMTAVCPAIVSGCALVLRRRFTPSDFWADVASENVTQLLYVGELIRILLSAPPRPQENEHRLRAAYGNGMGLDVWHRFQARFRVPRVFEYYGATELPLALVNLAGEPGFLGHTPFGRLSPWRVIARDSDTGELVRTADGTCLRCRSSESGELVLVNGLFGEKTGLVQAQDSRQHMQVVRDVARLGDEGLRTGDIVHRDPNGYVKFEDRTFEIFRQLGHNVSTSHLVRVIRGFAGVADVGVTHVILPHYDGQLGMAVIVPNGDFGLTALGAHLSGLSAFERPRFLRLASELRLNRAMKFDHGFYRREGINPAATTEPIFLYRQASFEHVNSETWAKLSTGQLRF